MSSSEPPYPFDDFFHSGKARELSPFLKKSSKRWGQNLHLKSSLLAGLFLLTSWIMKSFAIDLSYLFLLLVYFLVGTPALISTLHDLKKFEINIEVLMTLAAFLSFLIGSEIEGGLLLVLFAFSGGVEEAVTRKAKGALIRLSHLAPSKGVVIGEKDQVTEMAVKEIRVGTSLLVRAGEIIPLDGKVIEGSSFVNLVHLTGESVPVSKKKGDIVQAGSRNLDGTLTLQVTKNSADSTLSRIIQLIRDAQEKKPKLQRFLDKFGKKYAITIIALFFLFALSFPFLFHIPFFGLEGALYRALTFLIAASPCALIIATPIAYLSAISASAKQGILIKGGLTLDALSACHTIAFDKTGTLTSGNLTCEGAKRVAEAAYPLEMAISIAAALERHVTHPMAEAIRSFATKQNIAPYPLHHFNSVPGYGLEGKVLIEGKEVEVKIGNEAFISPKSPLKKEKYMISYLQIGSSLYSFHFTDTLRPRLLEVLEDLKKRGLHLIMLTGDHAESANGVGKKLGISEIYTNLTPDCKLEIVSKLSAKRHLMMVGDGVNDAPALTRATVGISMGKIGSGTAIDASDIVLLKDDLHLIGWLHTKAKKTMRIVKENVILALCVILFASIPALLGLIPLWLAVILHEGGTVIVGLNSLRLLKK